MSQSTAVYVMNERRSSRFIVFTILTPSLQLVHTRTFNPLRAIDGYMRPCFEFSGRIMAIVLFSHERFRHSDIWVNYLQDIRREVFKTKHLEITLLLP